MQVTVLGKRWNLVFVNASGLPKQTRGLCDGPHIRGKTISILKNQSLTMELDTLIHEMLHAAGWHIDERFVEAFATDVARALIKLNWTKSDAPAKSNS